MMTLLSGIFGALTGPLFRFVTIPVIALLAITGGHVLIEGWKEKHRVEGERRCDARWEAQIRAEERKKAAGEVFAARQMLDLERGMNERLYNELETVQGELDALRGATSGLDDGRCLSDGVLDRLGRKAVDPKRKQPGSRAGS